MGKTYRATWWRRLDEIALLAIFAMLGATVVGTWSNILISCLALMFIGGAIVLLAIILVSVTSVKIGEHHLVCRSLAGTAFISEPEIESIQVLRTGRSGAIRIRRRKNRDVFIPMKSFAEGLSLTDDIEGWWNLQRPNRNTLAEGQVRVFGMQLYPIVFLAPAIILLVPVVRSFGSIYDAIPVCGVCLPAIGLLVSGSISLFRRRVEISNEGLLVRRSGKTQRLKWTKVDKVTMKTYRMKDSNHECIYVESGGEKIYVDETCDEFPMIRDLIVSLVDPTVVSDVRVWQS